MCTKALIYIVTHFPAYDQQKEASLYNFVHADASYALPSDRIKIPERQKIKIAGRKQSRRRSCHRRQRHSPGNGPGNER